MTRPHAIMFHHFRGVEMFEVYRKFRTTCFESMGEFYKAFRLAVVRTNSWHRLEDLLRGYKHSDWGEYPFYTEEDTWFRHVREHLGEEQYGVVMGRMMQEKSINPETLADGLWMTPIDLQHLHQGGHIVKLYVMGQMQEATHA